MAVSANTKAIFNILKNASEAKTANDIQAELGLEKVASVTGAVNSLVKKEVAERIPATIEVTDADGKVTTKEIKLIQITDFGKTVSEDDLDSLGKKVADAE